MATDAGGHRAANEDAALAQPPVFAVADGMGGHARGEMASQMVVEELAALAGRPPARIGPADVGAAVDRAVARIRETMAAEAGAAFDPVRDTAGTTVAGVVRTQDDDGTPSWLVLNVGDSRVYRYSDGALRQVSVDHSLVQEMVDAGELDAAAARTHPRRNVITRAVGAAAETEIDFWVLHPGPGERLLMCTDGLVGELEDAEIAEVLAAVPDAQEAADALLRRALDGGANDNVTVVVVDPADAGAPAPTAPG
ncbi:PP2C family serine/threonine-protein phosphatase [Georgenia sp. SYP-B2076]|uniref:PP2C family protein-serine/threonine phosphatase n=1 Tax=Georgenia sp. SYP-B2076 TaxID=2495881 RepID=UPI001F0BB426|nr:protein phosphatase 2C domain-containing protein [Georgenia sp. SYP-B2076]